jgi:hypothetical protein
MIDIKLRNQIAQLFVDMNVGDSKPVRKPDMVPLLKEVNDTTMIGHAIRFVTNKEGDVIALKKYRKTAIEKRFENEGLH